MDNRLGFSIRSGSVATLIGLTALLACMSGCGGGSSTNVITAAVATVTVAPLSATIKTSGTQQFSATAKDANGNVLPGLTFSWTSDTTSVATIDGSGLATGVGAGTANITASTEGVTSGASVLTVTGTTSGNAIPASFYGFTVNRSCSIANTEPAGNSCGNPESHSFPGLPFTWSRSLGTGKLKWSDLVRCDPTGSVCPIPGNGCGKNGEGCTSSQLVAGCAPSSFNPDDPNNCAYFWQNFDWWTQQYNSHSVDWMYDAYYTPDYLSVRGSRCTGSGTADFGPDATCVGPADSCLGDEDGGCDPPFDIDATLGSGKADGTDQNYIWFVKAFVTHLQANGAHIKYWEVWNEPNICGEWNHKDEASEDCPSLGFAPSTGTATQLIRLAEDARSILPSSVSITTPPVTDSSAITDYLYTILSEGGKYFDIVGFHGYFNTHTGCPSSCPTPEAWVTEWNALSGVNSTKKPTMNTEFSWGANSNVTEPDMRAAFAARIYLLQESEYPALSRVAWYGEDFPIDLTPNPNNNNLPSGGTGEFWADGNSNVADRCSTPDAVQGGYDCPAGLAMQQVSTWTLGGTFQGPCSCSATPGGSCSSSPPTGIFQCRITESSGHAGLFVWDNTQTTFPCNNAPCGSTTFSIPSGFTADWQDLDGNKTSLGGATTVTIGAKPILIEN